MAEDKKPYKSAFLAGAREYAKQENKKKKTARTKKAGGLAEELRLDSIAGDEPPKSEAEFQRRKRERPSGPSLES
jgi:hypothetical protein